LKLLSPNSSPVGLSTGWYPRHGYCTLRLVSTVSTHHA